MLGGVFTFFLCLFYFVKHPTLPSKQHPLVFYSNQTSDDLKILFKEIIHKAKTSLFLQIYGCTDPHLIHEIKMASNRGVAVTLLYDPSASGPLKKILPFAIPLACQGLMHKKILIADNELVFIGSANFTTTSLRMHDNLVVGLYQQELASFILSSTKNHFEFKIEGQFAEFWHLPDFQNECLLKIINSIENAQNSIHLALFTFTHPQIIQALIAAKKRGVEVSIAIDFYSSQGASKKAVAELRKEGMPPLISQKGKLLHYKWALIDQDTLFLGSANWTKSAFCKNEDCIFSLQNLTENQKNYFNSLWTEIKKNSLQ